MQNLISVINFIWCYQKSWNLSQTNGCNPWPFLIFPGKSLISCYGASVLTENNERENNLLLSLLFQEFLLKIIRIVFKFSRVSISTSQGFLGKGLELLKFGRKHEYLSQHRGGILEAQLQHLWETDIHKEEIKATSRWGT